MNHPTDTLAPVSPIGEVQLSPRNQVGLRAGVLAGRVHPGLAVSGVLSPTVTSIITIG